nr:hypothetical protein [uncultured Marinobacter sp.]
MKLGKKKVTEVSVDEQPTAKAEKKPKSRASASSKMIHLGQTAIKQALVVLVAAVAAVALVYFLVLLPAAEQRYSAWKAAEADAALSA